jgi:hypothetical protein
MDALRRDMEQAYRRQVSLFEDLRDCLALEREYLISLNVTGIWDVIEKKRDILDRIDETVDEIIRLNEDLLVLKGRKGESSDSKIQDVFKEFTRRLTELKAEVRLRVKENAAFIYEALSFFEELVSVLAGGVQQVEYYEKTKKPQRISQPLILRREV